MRKRTPEELLRSIEETNDDEDVESILSMSEEEVKAELLAAGDAPADLDKAAEKLLGPRPEPLRSVAPGATPPAREVKDPPRVVPLRARPSRRFWGSVTAAAAGFAALLGYAQATGFFATDIVVTSPNPHAADEREAERLTEAAGAFEAGEWARCLGLLDQAKAKDPKGDDTPAVNEMRRTATAKVGQTDR